MLKESQDLRIKNLDFIESRFFLLLVACLFFLNSVSAQQNYPLNREWSLSSDKANAFISAKISNDSIKDSSIVYPNNSSFKPLLVNPSHQAKDKSRPWIVRKFTNENLFIINDSSDNFYVTIDPLFNFEGGMDLADASKEKLYKNTRGFLIRGDINKKLVFESSFYENQSTFAQYIDDYIASADSLFPFTNIVPGQGRTKPFRTNGYDYAMASGYVSYSPCNLLNVQVGHGKHFIGDGYRSLLLSDNSYNYPYARITTSYKNIQYTNLYTSFMNLNDGGVKTPANIERLFQKKVGSFQMLSADFFSRLTVGLFQGMIWEASDSTNHQHLNFNTFDPIIGVNSAVYGLHHKNNILLGATFKLKITNSITLFGQYMLDDINAKDLKGDIRKKNGYQIGFKYFDVFKIKNLNIQAEYNAVRPYAYAAANVSQSYTHYNQALAHPLGANFSEMVGFINYRFKRLFVQLKVNYAVKGIDSSGYNYGSNVFKSDNFFQTTQNVSSISALQGYKTTTLFQDFHLGYLVNPATNFNVVMGVSNRIFITNKATTNTRYVYVGIRTSLSNFYYDF